MTLIKTTYNRRSFLKVTGAAGGGMLLGFSFLTGCSPEEIEEQVQTLTMPDNWFDMNAFIKVGDNGVVTIMSPNPEIGQNVKTSMPMIVAEELDVDWTKVVVEQAGLSNDFTRQVAGGSQSIRQGWTSLRTAGATARRMLLEAAAQKMEVPVSELTTEAGVITHAGSGQSMGYGEVASEAAGMTVPEEIELKDPKDFKIIGQPTKNVDGPAIVTGKAVYGLDYQPEGTLVATLVHAPAFGMTLKSMDDTAVKAMPGITHVVKVDTGILGELAASSFAHVSQVAIVGKSTWEVMKAKGALQVEWERVSPAENTEMHNRIMDTVLNEKSLSGDKGGEHKNEFEKLEGIISQDPRMDGDPAAAFAAAAQVIERTYACPFLAHNTLEPMNFYADVTDEKAELVGPIQTPASLARIVSQVTGLEPEKVTVAMTRQGGGFGRRLYGHFGLEAAMISKSIGAPVKLVYTRDTDMTYGTYRPAYKVRYRAALNEANEMTAFEVVGVGAHGGPVWTNRFPAGAVDNYMAQDHGFATNVSTGAWRAPKSNFIAGAEQSFLDEVAEAAGKDPIEFRLELFERAKNNPVGEENDYDAERYAGVLKMVKEKSGWGEEKPGVHRGVAAYYCHNSYVAQVMDMVMKNGKPAIQKVWCAVDCGIVVNPEGALNQIEGGLVDGIGHAMYSGLTFKDGAAEQKNFDAYSLIRHSDAPMEIETFFVDNGIDPTGLGEPGLPPIMGALANALYKATGKRFYTQPFAQQEELLG